MPSFRIRVRQPEIEVGKIDGDEDVGPRSRRPRRSAAGRRRRCAAAAARPRAGRSPTGPEVGRSASRRRSRSRSLPKPVTCGRWIEPEDLARQRAGVHVTGRLAAGDHHAHRDSRGAFEAAAWPSAQAGVTWPGRKERRVERDVVFEAADAPHEERQPVALQPTAVNATCRPSTLAIVGEDLLHRRRLAGRAGTA